MSRLTSRAATAAIFSISMLSLAACGSSSDTGPASVSSVTTTSIAYGKSTKFTVTGSNLPATITPTATGCSNIVGTPSTSTTVKEFTCTPDALNVGVSINYGGTAPYTTIVPVPYPRVTLVTSMGSVVVELYPDKAPLTVKNFLSYVNTSFYDSTIFHRVVPGFVSQGGGFITDATNKIAIKTNTFAPIALESNNGLSNLKYTLAMARTNVPDSATSQFYFNATSNTNLDYSASQAAANGYAVFGKAVSGTAVLDSMNLVANATLTSGTYSGFNNVPTTPLVLQSATQTQ
jgi:cyclophilin family peptidyl-prolyl cis-trans isomerase